MNFGIGRIVEWEPYYKTDDSELVRSHSFCTGSVREIAGILTLNGGGISSFWAVSATNRFYWWRKLYLWRYKNARTMRNTVKLVGREKEISLLKDALRNEEAEMIAVIGRRRVGKTFLVRQTYQKELVFEFTGLQNGPRAE